jgi:hypothetical protein
LRESEVAVPSQRLETVDPLQCQGNHGHSHVASRRYWADPLCMCIPVTLVFHTQCHLAQSVVPGEVKCWDSSPPSFPPYLSFPSFFLSLRFCLILDKKGVARISKQKPYWMLSSGSSMLKPWSVKTQLRRNKYFPASWWRASGIQRAGVLHQQGEEIVLFPCTPNPPALCVWYEFISAQTWEGPRGPFISKVYMKRQENTLKALDFPMHL